MIFPNFQISCTFFSKFPFIIKPLPMKTLFTIFSLLVSQILFAQDEKPMPQAAVKWAPTGLIVGNISLHGEYKIRNKTSLTAKLGIPAAINYGPSYDGDDADLKMETFSFLAGYRMYLSRQALKGFYFEPFVKYLNNKITGTAKGEIDGDPVTMVLTNTYSGTGIGAQLGVQFLIARRVTIDIYFFGPEFNIADNHFKAVETSSTLPWNSTDAQEAEQDIRDFIDKFPFIRNKVNFNVNSAERTVTADFSGTVPGFRMGMSFGIAF